MAIAGTIQLITGTVTITATDSNGQTRELKPGDAVYEGETLKTEGNISISLVNENGDEIASL
ncbi:MAG: hypothetical protein HUK40_24195 [Desulfobacter sp.]|nr:hypothetical protein [Desulfobacter sp.]WDP86842.1 MAG: hypothetical protein HUN05_18355 [Desulfobacter sp.]